MTPEIQALLAGASSRAAEFDALQLRKRSNPELEALRDELFRQFVAEGFPGRPSPLVHQIAAVVAELHARELEYRRARGLRDPEAVQ
ncbi:MAG: hypothetical protein ACE37F_13085 [Nannocystaceae bacterium]|nr:hypothetical protein [bacterium]